MNTPRTRSIFYNEIEFKGGQPEIIKKPIKKKESYDLTIKNPKNALNICLTIIKVFEEVKGRHYTQRLLKNQEIINEKRFLTKFGKNTKFITKGESINDMATYSLMDANVHFVYFILNVTSQEFHKSYLNFIQKFNNSGDFRLNEHEFKTMLRVLCKKENIGRAKLSKCFSKVAASAFSKSKSIDEILNSNPQEELGPHLVKEIFAILRDESAHTEKDYIDYIKFLPIGIAFFSEDIKKKIETREELFQMVSGINSRGQKMTSKDNLLAKFESLGLEYKEDDSAALSISHIQKALIIFRNSCPSEFDFKQVDIILKKVQQKYKYDIILQDFKKPPKFNKKFITYLSYLVCMNFSCQNIAKKKTQDSQSLIVEEYALWNSLLYAKMKLDSTYISTRFPKYATKMSTKKFSPASNISFLGPTYIKKILPGIPKKNIDNIMNAFMQEELNSSTDAIIDDFGDYIYSLIIKEAENKLFEYITFNYDKFEPNNKTNLLEKPSVISQGNNFTNLEKENIPSNIYSSPDTKSQMLRGEELAPIKENISLNQNPQPFRSDMNDMNGSISKSEISTPKPRNLQEEKALQDFSSSFFSIKDNQKRGSLPASIGTYSDSPKEGNLVYRRSFMQENEKRKFEQNQKRAKNLVGACYTMGVFLEKASKPQILQNEAKPVIDKSFTLNDQEDEVSGSSQKEKDEDEEEDLELRPIDGLREMEFTYKDFNHEKLMFMRRIREKPKKKDKCGLCGIECCVM